MAVPSADDPGTLTAVRFTETGPPGPIAILLPKDVDTWTQTRGGFDVVHVYFTDDTREEIEQQLRETGLPPVTLPSASSGE